MHDSCAICWAVSILLLSVGPASISCCPAAADAALSFITTNGLELQLIYCQLPLHSKKCLSDVFEMYAMPP
jgi:hypothetical protein